MQQLRQVFPSGVCDYSKPGVNQKPLGGTYQRLPLRDAGSDLDVGLTIIAMAQGGASSAPYCFFLAASSAARSSARAPARMPTSP